MQNLFKTRVKNYQGFCCCLLLFVVVFLATGIWGVSESWGGDVQTSNRDPSGPIICRWLLHSYYSYSCSTLFVLHLMSARGGYLIIPLPYLPCRLLCLHTRWFSNLDVTCLCTRISRTVDPCIRILYLPASPVLITPIRFWIHSLAAVKISSKIEFSSFQDAVSATTSNGASPLHRDPSPCCKTHVMRTMPPIPPLMPAACQCMSPVSNNPGHK